VKKLPVAFRYLLNTAGLILVFSILFAFTTGPYSLYHWLGTSEGTFRFRPTHLVVLGGGGFPGETALLRCWYTSSLMKTFPEAHVLVSQATETSGDSTLTVAAAIRHELILRGIDRSSISMLPACRNTREEAIQTAGILGKEARVLIITSPEHMRRAVKSFRKAGLGTIGGVPTFADPGMADLRYDDKKLGGNDIPLPAVGQSTQLRYQVWNHLQYQLVCSRELLALAWYALRGWT
jgi:uncharacterized SAM-binding protein YcdF (DUF218 family)